MTSALNRVYWEQHILRPAWRDPSFYLQQGCGAVWDVLVRQPTTWDAERVAAELLPRLAAIPTILSDGRSNLGAAASTAAPTSAPTSALGQLYLDTVAYNDTTQTTPLGLALESSTAAIIDAVRPPLDAATAATLTAAAHAAASSLQSFSVFVALGTAHWPTNSSIGSENYLWFLRHVSLVNTTTDALLQMGRQQLSRARAMADVERRRNDRAGVPPTVPLAPDLASQINATAKSSAFVKAFLAREGLLQLPSWFEESAAYEVEGIPTWLAPFQYSQVGEEDDFTSAALSKAQTHHTSFARYVPAPTEGMPFFLDSLARDARPVIVHEGIPGHFTQFSYSW
jgi:hypothetical protein